MAASYKFGVEWIVVNDDVSEMDFEVVADQISTLLLADLFGKDPNKVAQDIIRFRKKDLKE